MMVDDPDDTCQSCAAPAGACRCEGAVASVTSTRRATVPDLPAHVTPGQEVTPAGAPIPRAGRTGPGGSSPRLPACPVPYDPHP